MGVDLGRLHAFMAEQFLNGSDVGDGHEAGREGVPQRVRGDSLVYGLVGESLDAAFECPGCEGRHSGVVGYGVVVGLWVAIGTCGNVGCFDGGAQVGVERYRSGAVGFGVRGL